MKTLPKEIFVKLDGEGRDQFLNCDVNIANIVTKDIEIIGVYRLVSKKKMKLVVTETIQESE